MGDDYGINALSKRRSPDLVVSRVSAAALSSLSEGLKVNVCMRTLTSLAGALTSAQHQKYCAEPLQARSVDLVLGINANVGGKYAALITLNQKTEQHRCSAVYTEGRP